MPSDTAITYDTNSLAMRLLRHVLGHTLNVLCPVMLLLPMQKCWQTPEPGQSHCQHIFANGDRMDTTASSEEHGGISKKRLIKSTIDTSRIELNPAQVRHSLWRGQCTSEGI